MSFDPPPTPASAAAGARAAERSVVLGYVPVASRAGFAAILALDDVLAGVVRTTREPIVGQMRLTWWYDALHALDRGAAAIGEPILAALRDVAVPRGVSGAALAEAIDGWESMLDPDPIDGAGLQAFARHRGATLFAAIATLLGGADDPAAIAAAGEGWALADLARHVRDPATTALARSMAADRFARAFAVRWPSRMRPLGMLALLVRADLADTAERPGSPRRLGRLLMHRIWGR